MSGTSMPRVLITRPAGQQQDFAKHCRQLGFNVSLLPCLQIVASQVEQQKLLQMLSIHEAVLFTSANAVRCAHAIAPMPWPANQVHAIGAATANCLQEHGQTIHLLPRSPFNSEAYLAQLAQHEPGSLLIIKGRGGRNLLQPHLSADGWQVDTLDVYERIMPTLSTQQIDEVFNPAHPDIISVTSDEILKNLYQLCLSHRDAMIKIPLVVNSERCATLASELGFTAEMLVAIPAGDSGQLECLDRWKQRLINSSS